jgi:hypothetical protein
MKVCSNFNIVSFIHSVESRNEGDKRMDLTNPAQRFTPLNQNSSPQPPANGNIYLAFFAFSCLTLRAEHRRGSAQPPVADEAAQPFTPAASCDGVNVASPNSTVSAISTATVDPFKSLALRRKSGSTLYTMGPVTPLSNPTTARLLQHYMDNLASWVRN